VGFWEGAHYSTGVAPSQGDKFMQISNFSRRRLVA
jgi:hypothetical protein